MASSARLSLYPVLTIGCHDVKLQYILFVVFILRYMVLTNAAKHLLLALATAVPSSLPLYQVKAVLFFYFQL